jgi:hypothetical protein
VKARVCNEGLSYYATFIGRGSIHILNIQIFNSTSTILCDFEMHIGIKLWIFNCFQLNKANVIGGNECNQSIQGHSGLLAIS